MEMAAVALCLIGLLVLFFGNIMFLIAAFREGVGWGLAVLFLPFAAPIFLLMRWQAARRSFLIELLGVSFMVLGIVASMAKGGSGLTDLKTRMLAMNPALFEEGEQTGAAAVEDSALPEGEASSGLVEPSASDPKTLVGQPLTEVRALLGRPKGEMRTGQGVCYLFPGFSVFSEDGRTVNYVQLDSEAAAGDRRATPARAATPSAAVDDVKTIANGGQKVDIAALVVPGKITIIDFYADWCGPCKRLGPELEKLARQDPDVVLRKVDIVNWDSPVVAQHGIRSVPNVRVHNRQGRQVGGSSSALGEIQQFIATAKR